MRSTQIEKLKSSVGQQAQATASWELVIWQRKKRERRKLHILNVPALNFFEKREEMRK